MSTQRQTDQPLPHEGYIPVNKTTLFYREIGQGPPIIILHGGPDFDHTYLLPDMDWISDAYRLIYYDQRGRGRSGENVQPEDVSLRSEIDDLDGVRTHLGLESVTLLGHSWGGILAMEYALRHPDRVSRLILLNSAFASYEDWMLFRKERLRYAAADVEELKARAASDAYRQGDPNAVADYYRVHFRAALRQPEHLEKIVHRLRASFTQNGILKARAIEDRLMAETCASRDYNLLSRLQALNVPTHVIHGELDFIPVECAAHIAGAIPLAHLTVLKGCGHFSFLECPDAVRAIIDSFMAGA